MTDAKLDSAAAAALARAGEEARRRQHAVVDPEHLLLALCAKEARERRAKALLLARQRALPLRVTLRRPGT